MRALIDTNVFISYLLDPKKDEKLQYIIEAAFWGEYNLISPSDLLEELKEKITKKPYLVKHVSKQTYKKFLKALTRVIDIIPTISEPIPEVSRDKEDDYLLAYATIGNADYLVTGDADLQVLKKVGKLKIVSPLEFYEILRK